MPESTGIPHLNAMRGRRKGGSSCTIPAAVLGLSDFIDTFLATLSQRSYSRASIDTHRWALRQFAQWAQKRHLHHPRHLERKDLQAYQQFLFHYRSPRGGKALGINTQIARLGCIRRFFAALCCQKSIARKLDMAHADYLLALKANHGGLHKRAEEFFSSAGHIRHTKQQGGTLSTADESNRAHGRIERRVVLATDSLWWIDKLEREDWPGLRSVVCVESHREQVGSGEKSVQKRYYLTSLAPDASRLQQLIRQHWSIENQCHWVLDVTFDEDKCRVRKDNAPLNLAMLRKACLSLLKQNTTLKDSLRGKRYRAALDENILESILFPQNSK